MKIKMHHSLEVAHNVVKLIDIPREYKDNITLLSWSNSREQGLCIQVALGKFGNWKKICVAENRNSDDIVVLYGKEKDFDFQTNQPSESCWSSRKTFRYDDSKGAADFILSEIMECADEELAMALKYREEAKIIS